MATKSVQTPAHQPAKPVSGFGLLGEELPTVPVIYRDELPRCVGACSQGRWPCRHPLACSIQQCDATEWEDIRAELTTDHGPLVDADPCEPLPSGYPVAWWVAMTLIGFVSLWLTLLPMPASAQDKWTGLDKRLHFAGGAVVAGSVQQVTGSPSLGFAVGVAVGVGKELWDMQAPGHTPSHRDAIVTFAGAALATSIPGLSIGPGWIAYRTSF